MLGRYGGGAVSHNNKAREKGTAWEVRARDFLRILHPRAERRALAGTADVGDFAGIEGWVISAKNCKKVELGKWLDEAEKQALRAGVSRFAVIFPRRSHATAKAFACVPLWLLSELMLPDEPVPSEREAV